MKNKFFSQKIRVFDSIQSTQGDSSDSDFKVNLPISIPIQILQTLVKILMQHNEAIEIA
jgi:hypothetical protein